MESAVDNLLRI